MMSVTKQEMEEIKQLKVRFTDLLRESEQNRELALFDEKAKWIDEESHDDRKFF